jgi:6-phosphogluconate dehydrogenase
MAQADIGLIGLAVMGENLVLNMESRGFSVAVYNRTLDKVDRFLSGRAKGKKITGCRSIEVLCRQLAKPRKVMLMVKAGKPVDDFIEQIIPFLEPGDIVIDGGNSHFLDSSRRALYLSAKGILFVGTGVSGGEEGALKGPAIMPGGAFAAWEHVRPVFQAIAAKADDGVPCCQWIGDGGAGHFVKMVHNGIEYGDMQLICEAYHIMRELLKMTADEMHEVFAEWNEGNLESYLIEITRDILAKKDEDGTPLVDKILDTAGQKGTGQWTAITALERAVPLTLIAEAVFARTLSAMKEARIEASRILKGPKHILPKNKKSFIRSLEQSLYASKLISYAQGFALMKAASEYYKWNLAYGNVAMIWRGGCIIRSKFLDNIKQAYEKDPGLTNLILDPYFREQIGSAQKGWRDVVSQALINGVPVPAMTSALTYYDGFRSERLPANLLQAQRDYFGAHTYERVDRPRGEFFHSIWK